MIRSYLTQINRLALIVLLLTVSLSACNILNKDEEEEEPIGLETPIIAQEIDWDQWNNLDTALGGELEDPEEVTPLNYIYPDVLPLPLGEWFSVRGGLYMRAQVWEDELFFSIQNQAVYAYIDTLLVLSYGQKDLYAFFVPADLVPPYDYQIDYVAVPFDTLDNVDSFRVVIEGGDNWNNLLALAEYTEMNLFHKYETGVKSGLFQSVVQTRRRSSFEDLDWSKLQPTIRYIEDPLTGSVGTVDPTQDISLHPGGLSQQELPNTLTQQIGNATMYDLKLNPVIMYEGLQLTNIRFNNYMNLVGTANNISNTGTSTFVRFELLNEDWEVLGTVSYRFFIADMTEDYSFAAPGTPNMLNARFIRVVD